MSMDAFDFSDLDLSDFDQLDIDVVEASTSVGAPEGGTSWISCSRACSCSCSCTVPDDYEGFTADSAGG